MIMIMSPLSQFWGGFEVGRTRGTKISALRPLLRIKWTHSCSLMFFLAISFHLPIPCLDKTASDKTATPKRATPKQQLQKQQLDRIATATKQLELKQQLPKQRLEIVFLKNIIDLTSIWAEFLGIYGDSRMPVLTLPWGNRCNFGGNKFRMIIFRTVLPLLVSYPIFQTDLKSSKNCSL